MRFISHFPLAALSSALFIVASMSGTGCNLGGPSDGVLGEESRAYFRPATPASTEVFTQGVMVGASFTVNVQPRDETEDAPLTNGTLRSTNDSVFVVDDPDAGAGQVRITGPGEAHLELVHDGETADRILVRGQLPSTVFLLDNTVAGSDIDARLPVSFGVMQGSSVGVTPYFQGRCGGAVSHAGQATLTSLDENVIVVTGVGDESLIEGVADGAASVAVMLDATEVTTFPLESVRGVDVDSVRIEIASTTETSAQLWGRAFAANTEIIGSLYDWSATPRMTLSEQKSAYTQAAILPVDEDAAPEVQAAVVDMSLFGLTASIDLLTATNDQLNPSRLPPAEEESAVGSGGCTPGAGDACDPYAVSLGMGALFLRRLRRKKRV